MAQMRGGGPELSADDPPTGGDGTNADLARAIGHALLRSGAFGVAVVGARDLRLVDVNPALAALTGRDRRALIGRPLAALLVGPMVGALAEAVARGDGGVTLAVATAPTADRPARAVDVTVQPLAADGAAAAAAVLVVREREPTTEALRDSERRYRSIVEHAYEGIWVLDVDARTTLVNRRMSDLLGYTPEEMVGRHLFDFMDDVGRAQATRNLERRAAGLAEDHEFRFVRRDGSDLWTICSTTPLQDDDGGYHGALAMVLDITERRRAEEAGRRLEAQMLETQKLESLGVLAGGIAHDFNNILTGILGNASLGLAVVRPGEPVADSLREIVEAATHAAELCRHMLAYSGKGRFVVERIDLGGLIESSAQMLHVSISKQASLRFRLERGLPAVEVDVAQIRQVVMNLVINASEALGDQRGEIEVRAAPLRIDRPSLERAAAAPLPEGDYVLLEVSDTGAGMSAETRARIFDPFFTTKFTGRGLGLAAVLGIVRGHRGAITVASEPGRGTTFQVLLPAVAGTLPTPSAAAAPVAAPWQGTGTVLLVDDEAGVRAVARRVLRWMGFDVVLAVDGDEAVAAFEADPDRFVVVLLDLTMPGRDGVQTFAALRALRPAVRVVLMSGFNEQDALTRFTGQGLASFVQKPFTAEALRAILQQVLDPDRARPG